MTRYSRLIQSGRIERGRFAPSQVECRLQISRRDLEAANRILDASPEWSYHISYNAMHQAGRAFMFHAGYRAKGAGHHATVVFFLRLGLPQHLQPYVAILDQMRRKRNRSTYDGVGLVSAVEAADALINAEEFVAHLCSLLENPV